MIKHHPPFDLLFDYGTGTLPEAPGLAVAAHLASCADCRSRVQVLESVGGCLLESCEPVAVDAEALETVMARLDEPERASGAIERNDTAVNPRWLPSPLWPYVRGGLSALKWRQVGRWFEEARLSVPTRGFKVSLMRIPAGARMPMHTHRGVEYTLVLAGGYKDGDEAFGPGDFDAKGSSHRHQPIVDPEEDCVCLVVLDAPVRLTGAMGRLINPFLRV